MFWTSYETWNRSDGVMRWLGGSYFFEIFTKKHRSVVCDPFSVLFEFKMHRLTSLVLKRSILRSKMQRFLNENHSIRGGVRYKMPIVLAIVWKILLRYKVPMLFGIDSNFDRVGNRHLIAQQQSRHSLSKTQLRAFYGALFHVDRWSLENDCPSVSFLCCAIR